MSEEQNKNQKSLRIESLQSRLDRLKPEQFTYQVKDKVILDEEKYVLTFKNLIDVKTLRPERQTDNPTMYLFGNGYFIRGVEPYFTQTNYQLFETMMSKRRNAELRQKLQAWSYVDADYFEQFDPNLLSLQNGVLNLKTGELHPHDPKYRMTTMLPIEHNPDADCGFFEEFVEQITPEPKRIQEMFGECLYRDYLSQKAHALLGGGANGKGTLMWCLMCMTGKENVSSRDLLSLSEDPYAVADLHHKYVNISSEQPGRKLTEAEQFKRTTGGDLMTARRIYQEPFQFINYAKIIVLANELPKAENLGFAFWRRWELHTFPYIFKGENEIKGLGYKLTNTPEKLSGILNWSIEGLQRLMKNNWRYSDSMSVKEIKEQWNRSADPVLHFILSYVESDKNGNEYNNDVLHAFTLVCKEFGMEKSPVSPQSFWRYWRKYLVGTEDKPGKLRDQYPYVEKKQESGGGSGTYYWKGIKLVDIPEEEKL